MISLCQIEIKKKKEKEQESHLKNLSYLNTQFKIQLNSNSLGTNDHLSHSHSSIWTKTVVVIFFFVECKFLAT